MSETLEAAKAACKAARWPEQHRDDCGWCAHVGRQRRLNELLLAFRRSQPDLGIWERYPDVSAAEDARTDTYACDQLSALFTDFCLAQGVAAVRVSADGALQAFADYHLWTRVFVDGESFDVDWTARQYHNLQQPPVPEHADLPCPLVWAADDVHPVVGAFRTVVAA